MTDASSDHYDSAVIAALISYPDKRSEIIALLAPDDFQDAGHRSLYVAISALHADGDDIDIVSIAERVEQHGQWDSNLWKELIEASHQSLPSDGMSAAKALRDKSVTRQLNHIGERLAKLNGKANPPAEIGDLRGALDKLTGRYHEGPPQPRGEIVSLLAAELAEKPPPVEVLVEGLFPRSAAMLLVGIGGAGKTSLLLSLACSVATGEQFAGRSCNAGKTLFITAEDRGHRIKHRLQSYLNSKICNFKQWHHAGIADNVSIYDVSRETNYLVRQDPMTGLPATTAAMSELHEMIARTRPALAIIDPAALFVANENDNTLMAALMRDLNGIADDTGASILFSSHTSKQSAREGLADAHAARGASALGDNGRGTFVLRDAGKDDDCPLRNELAEARKLLGEDCEIVVLENPRQSLIKRSDPLWFVRGAGGAILPLGSGKRRSVDQKRDERRSEIQAGILAMLRDNPDGLPRSTMQTAIRCKAATILEELEELEENGLIRAEKRPVKLGRPVIVYLVN